MNLLPLVATYHAQTSPHPPIHVYTHHHRYTQRARSESAQSHNSRRHIDSPKARYGIYNPPRFDFSSAVSSGQEWYSTMHTAVVSVVWRAKIRRLRCSVGESRLQQVFSWEQNISSEVHEYIIRAESTEWPLSICRYRNR